MFRSINAIFSNQRLLRILPGHSGPVNCLSISPRGNLLASGGYDGLKIWDLKSFKEIDAPQLSPNARSQVACVYWITREDEAFDTLCYGNALGYLVFLQHRAAEDRFETIHECRIGQGGEIMALTADTTWGATTRIATSTRDKCVQVWAFDHTSRTLLPVFSKMYGDKDIVPKAVAFDNNSDRDLYVFGMYDGGLYKYGGVSAKLMSIQQLGSSIGNAAVDIRRKLCAVDNSGNGFDLYKMDNGLFVRNFPTRAPDRTYPKGVVFANDYQVVVGGSDHGRVYIFDRKTGEVLALLKHAKHEGVETISVHDKDDGSVLIASASATTGQTHATHIRVWKWMPKVMKSSKAQNAKEGWRVISAMYFVMNVIMMFATIAYFLGALESYLGYQLFERPYQPRAVMKAELGNDALQELIRQTIMAEMKAAQPPSTYQSPPGFKGAQEAVVVHAAAKQSDDKSESPSGREAEVDDVVKKSDDPLEKNGVQGLQLAPTFHHATAQTSRTRASSMDAVN